jgi:LysM repeat protein
MKILKIFGVVVGIHLFALVLIFANPGCSSTTKPPPAPIDTVARTDAAPTITVPTSNPMPTGDMAGSPVSPAPAFNPDAPATYASSSSVHFTPTRPNTAVASTLVTQPVTDVTPASTYAVKSGDSLWTIARKNHITYSELAAANNLKTSATLHEGQKLIIPGKVSPPATSTASSTPATSGSAAGKGTDTNTTASNAAAKASGEPMKHVVKSGETLGAIARQYDVKQGEIAVANNITDPKKIRPGMELIIPGWKATGGKSGKSNANESKANAAKNTEPKPVFNIIEPDKNPPPAAPGEVPVIKVDENPLTPAPKS